jgi:hypothetical protein
MLKRDLNMNNIVNEITSKGVVSFTPKVDSTVVWKDIPGFSRYLASNTGLVVNKEDNQTPLPMREFPTTVGSYVSVSVLGDDLKWWSMGVHRLIAFAFHGYPSPLLGSKPEVNHLDGNKHNNQTDNLQWTNRSGNLLHAVESGLRTDTIRITVIDHLEETEKLYHAISVVAKAFKVKPEIMKSIISRHGAELWNGRYTFIKDDSGFKEKKRTNVVYFKIKDYKTGEVYLTDSSVGGMDITKVFFGTIQWRLMKRNIDLCNGFVFMSVDDSREFPEYTEDEINSSITVWETRPARKAKRFGVVGKYYPTGEILEFETIKNADKHLGVVVVSYLLNRDSRILYKGWFFQYRQELTEWPEFDKEYVEVSVRIKKPEYPPVYVTDLETDTTKLYATLKEFAEQNGVWATNVSSHLRLKPDEAYKKRWMFKFYDIT